jgi:hypothetical protein
VDAGTAVVVGFAVVGTAFVVDVAAVVGTAVVVGVALVGAAFVVCFGVFLQSTTRVGLVFLGFCFISKVLGSSNFLAPVMFMAT